MKTANVERLFKFPHGRTYYKDEQGRVLVFNTDYNTPTPLFLLTDRPIELGEFARVEVIDDQGKYGAILESVPNGVELCLKLGMKLKANGKIVTVKEEGE